MQDVEYHFEQCQIVQTNGELKGFCEKSLVCRLIDQGNRIVNSIALYMLSQVKLPQGSTGRRRKR